MKRVFPPSHFFHLLFPLLLSFLVFFFLFVFFVFLFYFKIRSTIILYCLSPFFKYIIYLFLQAGGTLLSYYNYNLATALRDLFTEINFDVGKFHAPPSMFYFSVDLLYPPSPLTYNLRGLLKRRW